MDSDNEQPEQHNEDTWQFGEDVVHGYLAQEEERGENPGQRRQKRRKLLPWQIPELLIVFNPSPLDHSPQPRDIASPGMIQEHGDGFGVQMLGYMA